MGNRPSLHSFDTYYGLERIVANRDEMLEHLRQGIDDFERSGFKRSVGKRRDGGHGAVDVDYGQICFFADTFFSDTIERADLHRIFSVAAQWGVPCKILLLNPFSDQARLRAVTLAAEQAQAKLNKRRTTPPVLPLLLQRALHARENWPTYEIDRRARADALDELFPLAMGRSHRGFANIEAAGTALLERKPIAPPEDTPPDDEIFAHWSELVGRVEEVCQALKNANPRFDLEIAFTSEPFSIPIYLFGCFVYDGTLMAGASAAGKPWRIFRDDASRNDDPYEVTTEAFNQAWRVALPLQRLRQLLKENKGWAEHAGGQRQLMVAYSEVNKPAMDQLHRIVSELGYDANCLLHFRKEVTEGDASKQVVNRILDRACGGIALMLPDEELTIHGAEGDSVRRSRPNVIHELGLMQGRFGFGRVLVIQTQGAKNYEEPSNIRGMNTSQVRVVNGRLDDSDLIKAIGPFFEARGIQRV